MDYFLKIITLAVQNLDKRQIRMAYYQLKAAIIREVGEEASIIKTMNIIEANPDTHGLWTEFKEQVQETNLHENPAITQMIQPDSATNLSEMLSMGSDINQDSDEDHYEAGLPGDSTTDPPDAEHMMG